MQIDPVGRPNRAGGRKQPQAVHPWRVWVQSSPKPPISARAYHRRHGL